MISKITARLPAILNFKSERSNRDRDPQQGKSGYGENDGRQPNQEDAQSAFANLLEQESIKLNGLTLELVNEEGLPAILVKNPNGQILKTIRGTDLLRLSRSEKSSARILDRRV